MSQFTKELINIGMKQAAVKQAQQSIKFAIGNAIRCGENDLVVELKERRAELEEERKDLSQQVLKLVRSLR